MKSLPKTLGDIYQQRLEAVIPDDRGDVLRLLGWLLYTCHPLSTTEFAQLLAFDYSEAKPTYRRSWEPTSSDDILNLVGSTFLSIHGDEVRLAHASVREFLLSLRSSSPFYISQNLMHSIMIQTNMRTQTDSTRNDSSAILSAPSTTVETAPSSKARTRTGGRRTASARAEGYALVSVWRRTV